MKMGIPPLRGVASVWLNLYNWESKLVSFLLNSLYERTVGCVEGAVCEGGGWGVGLVGV